MNLVMKWLVVEVGDERAGQRNMTAHRGNNERLMIMNAGAQGIFLRNLIAAHRLEDQITHLGFFVPGQEQGSKLRIKFQEAVPVAIGFVAAAILLTTARSIA